MEFSTVSVFELKEDKTLSKLVPEMTTDEYEHFVDSVKKSGVQTPIHIRNDMTILDGRHRVRACKQLGIMEIECLVHSFDKSESIEFVRDTAIERRNLSKAQRVDIVLRTSDLINAIEEEAQKRARGSFKGNQYRVVEESTGADTKKGKTDDILADIAGVGSMTVTRMKKIKREAPEIYEQVVKGEKTISGAYNKLPTTAKPKKRSEYPSGQKNIIPINIPKPMTPDETKMLMAVENLDLNFNQIIHYVNNNGEKLYDAICQTYEERPEFMEKAHTALHQLLNLMDAYKGGKHNDKTI